MKHLLFSFVCIFLFELSYSQDEQVNITTKETDSTLVFIANNHSEARTQLTLKITVKNLTGYNGPITKLVSAKDSMKMIELSVPQNEPWSYQINYTYKTSPTEEELLNQNNRIKRELLSSLNVDEEALLVFYGDGCTRSSYTMEMLKRKKISFAYLDASSNEYYSKVMFELLRQQQPDIKTVQYPVIMVNNQLDYDIENLRWYLKELISERKRL